QSGQSLRRASIAVRHPIGNPKRGLRSAATSARSILENGPLQLASTGLPCQVELFPRAERPSPRNWLASTDLGGHFNYFQQVNGFANLDRCENWIICPDRIRRSGLNRTERRFRLSMTVGVPVSAGVFSPTKCTGRSRDSNCTYYGCGTGSRLGIG